MNGNWIDGTNYTENDYASPSQDNGGFELKYPWYEWRYYSYGCTQMLDDKLYQLQTHDCSAKQDLYVIHVMVN